MQPLRRGPAWRRTTSAASLLRKHALAVDCPAGAIIVRSPVSLRSTVAPRAQPRTASQQRQFSLRAFFCCQKKAGFRETAVPGQRFHDPEHHPINRTPKRPKNCLVRHCGQNAHNSSENMCNFLNKTPLRKGVFFGTIKLCKSVCLELCPEQHWGTCQAALDLCGPDNRTAL